MTGAMNNRAQLAKDLEAFPVRWKPGQRMSELTSLAVGGPVDVVVIEDPQCLPDVVHFFPEQGNPLALARRRFQSSGERRGVAFDCPAACAGKKRGSLRWSSGGNFGSGQSGHRGDTVREKKTWEALRDWSACRVRPAERSI